VIFVLAMMMMMNGTVIGFTFQEKMGSREFWLPLIA
jgi:hypothetical protein